VSLADRSTHHQARTRRARHHHEPDARPPIGLLAGSGRFPIHFAQAAKRQGFRVACVGVKYEASPDLIDLCDSFDPVGVARMGQMIRTFRKRGVGSVVMAGKITKAVIHTPRRWLALWPDLRTVRYWYKTVRADRRDDALLLGVIEEFARDGLHFASALDFCPELLVKTGLLTRRRPTAVELEDVAYGWRLAKEMGRLDVGQSVAVKELSALAVEAIEGTDRCIERAGHLCRAGGWTLVKVAKPEQDMRFDVPTVGLSTVENLAKAGARVLAIESGRTIVLDQDDVVARADKLGLAIVAIDPNDMT
jgi:DUF1009 family protein